MYILQKSIPFPPVSLADAEGLLAIGGNLSTERLLEAYYKGIFPWYSEGQPILWFSPDPRMVLFPEEFKLSKSMRQLLRKEHFDVTFNQAFDQVINECATIQRSGQDGTWITHEMQQAYIAMYRLGYAMSVEVWFQDQLVGGLYGIWLEDKKLFCGESMFTKMSNASKYGFTKLIENLKSKGVRLIDCQMHTNHLASLGAREISREEFMKFLIAGP